MFKTFLIIGLCILLGYNLSKYVYHTYKSSTLMNKLEGFLDQAYVGAMERTKILYLKHKHEQIVGLIWCILLTALIFINTFV